MPSRNRGTDSNTPRQDERASDEPRRGRRETELVDTGFDLPDAADAGVDPLTRDEVESDPGEATRKLPKNDQAV